MELNLACLNAPSAHTAVFAAGHILTVRRDLQRWMLDNAVIKIILWIVENHLRNQLTSVRVPLANLAVSTRTQQGLAVLGKNKGARLFSVAPIQRRATGKVFHGLCDESLDFAAEAVECAGLTRPALQRKGMWPWKLRETCGPSCGAVADCAEREGTHCRGIYFPSAARICRIAPR